MVYCAKLVSYIKQKFVYVKPVGWQNTSKVAYKCVENEDVAIFLDYVLWCLLLHVHYIYVFACEHVFYGRT